MNLTLDRGTRCFTYVTRPAPGLCDTWLPRRTWLAGSTESEESDDDALDDDDHVFIDDDPATVDEEFDEDDFDDDFDDDFEEEFDDSDSDLEGDLDDADEGGEALDDEDF